MLEVTVHLVTHRRSASYRKSLQKKKNHLANNENTPEGDEWDWYDVNHEEINGDFLELLEASVIPRMFGEEFEDFHRKENPSIFPQENDEISGLTSKSRGGKRKRNVAIGKKQHRTKHRGLAAIKKKDSDENDKNPDKDIYFSFGQFIQLAYKKQPINNDKSSWTILFRSNGNNKNGENESKIRAPKQDGSFHDRKKLSHRLLVWISKSDVATSTSKDEDTLVSRPGEGIYRPEMIPISKLFRKPKELIALSDDEDD